MDLLGSPGMYSVAQNAGKKGGKIWKDGDKPPGPSRAAGKKGEKPGTDRGDAGGDKRESVGSASSAAGLPGADEQGLDGKALAVGFLGLGSRSADVANLVAECALFTDAALPSCGVPRAGADPLIPAAIQTSHVPSKSRVYMYLSASSMSPVELMQGYHASRSSAPGSEATGAAGTVVDYAEDRHIQYLRSVTFMLMVCHVVVFVHPQGQVSVDCSLLRMLRIAQTIRQAAAPAVAELARGRGAALSGSQFSPGRVLPIAAFVFLKRGAAGHPAHRAWVAENTLEQQLRLFLRATKLLGSASDRDGPDTPILVLDPTKCAFVLNNVRYESPEAEAAGEAHRQVDALKDFIWRQSQYILRQMASGGKRYELPSTEAWLREASVMDALLRLGNAYRTHNKTVEHTAFARLHPMINPLFKYSYSRSLYANNLALDNVHAFLSQRLANSPALGPADKQHQWHCCLAVFNRYALGPLQEELRVQLKEEFDRMWEGQHEEQKQQQQQKKYDVADDDEEATSPNRAVERSDRQPKQLLAVVSTCGTSVLHLPQEERDDHEATTVRSTRPIFLSLHTTNSTELHLVTFTLVIITSNLPLNCLPIVSPAPHTYPSPQQLPPLNEHSLADYFESTLVQKAKTKGQCFKDVQKVTVRLHPTTGQAMLSTCDGTKQRWIDAADDAGGLSGAEGQTEGEELLGGALVGGLVFDAITSVTTLPTRAVAAALSSSAAGPSAVVQGNGVSQASVSGGSSRKRGDGKRARRRKDGNPSSSSSQKVTGSRGVETTGWRWVPTTTPTHGNLYIMLEYICLSSGIRWSLDASHPQIMPPDPSVNPSPALPACDVPLFVLSPASLFFNERRARDLVSQLQRIYLVTDRSDAVWNLSPSVAFFKRGTVDGSALTKKDVCNNPSDREYQDETLHELIKLDTPVALPHSSVMCLRLPRTYPLEMSSYKSRRNSAYLLHGFVTLS
ncbi:Protein SMG8 [Diplonema papillatum]|nr:Protein SMG8 [Diplonema papillatum]